jgi:hypothetical protein
MLFCFYQNNMSYFELNEGIENGFSTFFVEEGIYEVRKDGINPLNNQKWPSRRISVRLNKKTP